MEVCQKILEFLRANWYFRNKVWYSIHQKSIEEYDIFTEIGGRERKTDEERKPLRD